jgi:hypothetical protein
MYQPKLRLATLLSTNAALPCVIQYVVAMTRPLGSNTHHDAWLTKYNNQPRQPRMSECRSKSHGNKNPFYRADVICIVGLLLVLLVLLVVVVVVVMLASRACVAGMLLLMLMLMVATAQ